MYTLVPYTSLFLSLRIAEAAVHGEVAESLGERRPALDRQDDAAHTAVAVVAGNDLGLVHARELGFGEPGDIDLHAGARGPVQGRGEGGVARDMSGVEDRKSVGEGEWGSGRVDPDGRRIINKKTTNQQ